MDPEQKLSDWFTFEDGMYNCKSCNVDKLFKSDRIDNCTRHVNEKHLKQKKQCHDCGKKMTSSALSRHKKKHCLKRNNLSIVPAHVDETLPETPPESPTLLDVKEYSVNIKVKFQTAADGTTIISYDDISIGGLIFSLIPKSVEGKLIKFEFNCCRMLIHNALLIRNHSNEYIFPIYRSN